MKEAVGRKLGDREHQLIGHAVKICRWEIKGGARMDGNWG